MFKILLPCLRRLFHFTQQSHAIFNQRADSQLVLRLYLRILRDEPVDKRNQRGAGDQILRLTRNYVWFECRPHLAMIRTLENFPSFRSR